MKNSVISFIPSMFKKLSTKEMVIMVAFIIYIILPISTPSSLLGFINSTIGLVSIFAITIAFFVKGYTLLGILFIFVAYELLRRSSIVNSAILNEHELTSYIPDAVPVSVVSQSEKDADLASMNPTVSKSLEEEMIEIRAPIGGSAMMSFVETSYKPISAELHGASML